MTIDFSPCSGCDKNKSDDARQQRCEEDDELRDDNDDEAENEKIGEWEY